MREGVAARDAAGLLPAAMQRNCLDNVWQVCYPLQDHCLHKLPGWNYSSIKTLS